MRRVVLERGLSLVELLVGVAVGMLVIGAATALLVNQLRETARLVRATQLTQDLRSATELVADELRRQGHWRNAVDGLRSSDGAAPFASNPFAPALPPLKGDPVTYRYAQDARDHVEDFGFRLRNGTIEMLLGGGAWQSLTDKDSMEVTGFRVTPSSQSFSLAPFCPVSCLVEDSTCPPRQIVVGYQVDIEARSVDAPRARRTSSARVRVRNDALSGSCGP